jgi:hypothetical protein
MDTEIVAVFCLCDDMLKALHHHEDQLLGQLILQKEVYTNWDRPISPTLMTLAVSINRQGLKFIQIFFSGCLGIITGWQVNGLNLI